MSHSISFTFRKRKFCLSLFCNVWGWYEHVALPVLLFWHLVSRLKLINAVNQKLKYEPSHLLLPCSPHWPQTIMASRPHNTLLDHNRKSPRCPLSITDSEIQKCECDQWYVSYISSALLSRRFEMSDTVLMDALSPSLGHVYWPLLSSFYGLYRVSDIAKWSAEILGSSQAMLNLLTSNYHKR